MTSIQQYIKEHNFIPFAPIFPEQEIHDAIHDLATAEKTKGQHFFKRFYENDNDLFREFRHLNADPKNVKKTVFHEVGERVVGKLWYLEQILTDKMIKRDTDKTITAFYDHVRIFFPLFDKVGIE